jgi:hypothetical protein
MRWMSKLHAGGSAPRSAASETRFCEAKPIIETLRGSRLPTIEAVRKSVAALYRDQSMIEHLVEGIKKSRIA